MLGGARGHVGPFTRALAAPFVWLRIPANGITLTTIVPAAAAAYYVATGEWAMSLVFGVVASFFDLIDGAVARATDRVTPFGGFLDSVVDRVVDVLFLFGVGFALGTKEAWVLVGAGVIGGLGTPYARARAYEAMDDVPEGVWQQMFERPERLIVLGLGVLAQMIAETQGLAAQRELLLYALSLYVVGSLLTLVQRVLKVRSLLAVRTSRRVTRRGARAPSSRSGP